MKPEGAAKAGGEIVSDRVSTPAPAALDLEAIRARHRRTVLSSNSTDWIQSAEDVPALIAEIERLRTPSGATDEALERLECETEAQEGHAAQREGEQVSDRAESFCASCGHPASLHDDVRCHALVEMIHGETVWDEPCDCDGFTEEATE